MTEDQAKMKWCPFSRFVIDAPTQFSGNRWDNGDGSATGSMAQKGCLCLASGCMSWRLLPLMADDAFQKAVIKASAELDDKTNGRYVAAKYVMANRAKYGLPTELFDGYCGLAGKPS
jgi:hypothetical protein